MQGKEVDHGPAFRCSRCLGDFVDFAPVDPSPVAEKQEVGVHGGNEELRHEILGSRHHPDLTAAAPPLGPVEADGISLDVIAVGNGYHHLLIDDQVLDVQILRLLHDLGSSLVPVCLPDLEQLLLDDLHHDLLFRKYLLEPRDGFFHLCKLVLQLLPLESR